MTYDAKAPGHSGSGRTRQIWGEDFDLPEDGLDPDQVVRQVEDLLARHRRLEERSRGPTSVNMCLRNVIGGMDRAEETISVQVQGYMREETHAVSERPLAEIQGLSQDTQRLKDQWKRRGARASTLDDCGVVLEEDASFGISQSKAHG